jgi:hypothetical protein
VAGRRGGEGGAAGLVGRHGDGAKDGAAEDRTEEDGTVWGWSGGGRRGHALGRP